jgi:hypothetical protein
MKSDFYYVDAVCYSAERSGASAIIPLLEKLHAYAPFHGKTAYEGFQPDYNQERLAYPELVFGRTLARCGSAEGFITLTSYLSDSRALLAEQAHTELVAIIGEVTARKCASGANGWSFTGIAQRASSIACQQSRCRHAVKGSSPSDAKTMRIARQIVGLALQFKAHEIGEEKP